MSGPAQTHQVGDAMIFKVEEQLLPGIPPAFLYPGLDDGGFAAIRSEISPRHLGLSDSDITLSVHSWAVRTPERLMIIDTCCGNGKPRPQNPTFDRLDTPYLERLRAAGVDPEEVDVVVNTHLHVDHSGWNTRLVEGRWTPTFPNARHLFPRAEQDYYASEASHNAVNVPSLGVYEDSVAPVIEAGLAEFIEPEGGCILGLEFLPTPGHSIGHMSIVLSSGGLEAIFAGDVLHTALQVARPDLNTVYCEFGDEALTSRRTVLERAARTGALYCSSHMPGTSAGRVSIGPEGFQWSDVL